MGFETVYKRLGVVIVEHALDQDRDLAALDRAFGPVERGSFGVGSRGVSSSPSSSDHATSDSALTATNPVSLVPADLADWAETHPVFINLASRLLAAPAQLVRIVPVDETRPAHWLAPWRQVRQIAVEERFRVSGFRNWSERDGVWLVEPPDWVLQQTVVLRVYLDDCRALNGPFEVLTNTHEQGRMKRVDIAEAAKESKALTCLCDRGDILALSPLALRRRHRASKLNRGRVVELTLSAANLPEPISWAPLVPELETLTAQMKLDD
ncbi:MAG: phytanoyl-CoA dioxygenase family protein [Pseudomonadota bacterium]